MKQRQLLVKTAILVSGFALALSSLGAMASAMPAWQKQGDINYVTGGLAKADAAAIEHAARYYPLQLEFLLEGKSQREHLSHVNVWIKDAKGKMVLDVTADGPFLLARLPAGKYTISADLGGEVKSRVVRIVPQRHQRAVFKWQA